MISSRLLLLQTGEKYFKTLESRCSSVNVNVILEKLITLLLKLSEEFELMLFDLGCELSNFLGLGL